MITTRRRWADRHVIHIGFHKTASTWLQREVFPAVTDHHFIRREQIFGSLIRNLKSAPEGSFAPEALATAVTERSRQVGQPLLISDEQLSGAVWHGGWNGLRNAGRLRGAVPNAAILIVIRRQDEMFRSLYAQYIQEGGVAAAVPFLRGRAPHCSIDGQHLMYDLLIARCIDLFGADFVHVLPFEILKRAPRRFLEQIGELLDVPIPSIRVRPANRSISPNSLVALRLWNAAFRRSKFNDEPRIAPLPMGRIVRRVVQHRVDPVVRRLPRIRSNVNASKMDEEIRSMMRAFGPSNERTQGFCDHDLRELGYTLPC